ncbi:MAG: hypothetical protein MK220_04940, partial [Candidatus Poseidoniia archaeon]|nr:hypothetical protein [Candidatus Poseidoniia archaeon]
MNLLKKIAVGLVGFIVITSALGVIIAFLVPKEAVERQISRGPFELQKDTYLQIKPNHYAVISGDFATLEWEIKVEGSGDVDVFYMDAENFLEYASARPFSFNNELSALNASSVTKGPVEDLGHKQEHLGLKNGELSLLRREYFIIDNTAAGEAFPQEPPIGEEYGTLDGPGVVSVQIKKFVFTTNFPVASDGIDSDYGQNNLGDCYIWTTAATIYFGDVFDPYDD